VGFDQRLYHHDIMGSIAMALTTLPMPKYLPDTGPDSIPYEEWKGTKLGNTQTCEEQGFFFTFGLSAMFCYNSMLCVYYACAIALKMQERRIRRFVEPILHLLPISLGLIFSIKPLIDKNYNPSGLKSWCLPTPLGCNTETGICVRGTYKFYQEIDTVMFAAIGILFFIIIVSLTMVSLWVFRASRNFKTLVKVQSTGADCRSGLPQKEPISIERIKKNHESTKAVLRQAVVYVLAFVITLTSPIMQFIFPNESHLPNYLEPFFMPLQGFFNFGIFLYYMVDNFRRSNPEVSTSEIVRLLIKGKVVEPVLISRISLLQFDEENKRVLQVGIIDDREEEYFSYDVSKAVAKDEIDFVDEIGSADRARIEAGLSFVLKNVPYVSHSSSCRKSVVSFSGGVIGLNELKSGVSSKIDPSFPVASNETNPDSANTRSSRGGLSGFDESKGSSSDDWSS
jgi:hypothetical protein